MYRHSAQKRAARGHANGNGYKRGRVARSYVPRGRFLNYRTGGFEGKELKYYDTGNGAYQLWPANNHYVIALGNSVSTPPQGVGGQERIGRRFSTKSILVKVGVRMGASADNINPIKTLIVHAYIVLDKQCNKAILGNATDVFDRGDLNPPFINMENTDRFKILKSMVITVDPTGYKPEQPSVTTPYAAWAGNPEAHKSMYVKTHINTLCEPGATLGGSASTMDNAVYVILWTNSTTADIANVNQPSYAVTVRTRFCC